MNDIIRAPAEESVVLTDEETSGRFRALHHKWKCDIPMKDNILEFTSPRQNVLDHFARTNASAKVCVLLSRHGRFLGAILTPYFLEIRYSGSGRACETNPQWGVRHSA